MKAIVIYIIIFIITVGLLNTILPKKVETFSQLTSEVLSKCRTSSYTPSCYDKEIPKLLDRISMEEAFKITKKIQSIDSKYFYCHVLAHNIAAAETRKNPSDWKNIIARCPANMCNYGCSHGVLMEKFKRESLSDDQIEKILPDLKDVCEPRNNWRPSEDERSICYHGIGHLNMYITNGDILKSLDLCKIIATKGDKRNYTQTCTEAVFMEIYQPLEPEDIKLVKTIAPKSPEEINSFCSRFTGEAYHACHRESWPMFSDEIIKPEGLVKFCSYTNDIPYQEKCTGTVFNYLTIPLVVNNNQKLDKLVEFCTMLTNQNIQWCFRDVAARLIQIDPSYLDVSLNICQKADELGAGNDCYARIVLYIDRAYIKSSIERKNSCRKLPIAWQEKCLINLY